MVPVGVHAGSGQLTQVAVLSSVRQNTLSSTATKTLPVVGSSAKPPIADIFEVAVDPAINSWSAQAALVVALKQAMVGMPGFPAPLFVVAPSDPESRSFARRSYF